MLFVVEVAATLCGMQNANSTSDIVLLDELARRLRLPKSFLERETRAGRIPSLRAGNRRVFNPEAVQRALAEQAARGGEAVSLD